MDIFTTVTGRASEVRRSVIWNDDARSFLEHLLIIEADGTEQAVIREGDEPFFRRNGMYVLLYRNNALALAHRLADGAQVIIGSGPGANGQKYWQLAAAFAGGAAIVPFVALKARKPLAALLSLPFAAIGYAGKRLHDWDLEQRVEEERQWRDVLAIAIERYEARVRSQQ